MDENIHRLLQPNLRQHRSRNEKHIDDGNVNRNRRSEVAGHRTAKHNENILATNGSTHHVIRNDNKSNNHIVPGYAQSIPVVITDDDDNELNGNHNVQYHNIQMNRSEDDSNSSADDDYYRDGTSDDDECDDDIDEDSRRIHQPKFRRTLFNGQHQASKHISRNTTSNNYNKTDPQDLYVETAYNSNNGQAATAEVGARSRVSSIIPNSDPFMATAEVDHESNNTKRKDEALAYLLRYETMVRQQEAEDMAVVAHLAPCLLRLEQLIRRSNRKNGGKNIPETEKLDQVQSSSVPSDWMDRVFTYSDLHLGLLILEKMSNDGKERQDQKVKASKIEFITTDRQFMMILRMLATNPYPAELDIDETSISEIDDGIFITWLEIIQCYKVCITGMVALEHIPTLIARSSESVATPINCDDDVRTRTRNRTLDMVSLFRSSLQLTQFYQMQQQKRSFKSTNTRRDSRERSNIERSIFNTEKKDKKATSNPRNLSIKHNKSWLGSLILIAAAAVLLSILLDRMHMLNALSTVFIRGKYYEATVINRTVVNTSCGSQQLDLLETNVTSGFVEPMDKEIAKDFRTDRLNRLSVKDFSYADEKTNTGDTVANTLTQTRPRSTQSIIARNPSDLVVSAQSRPPSESVSAMVMTSFVVLSTTVGPMLLIGPILSAIMIPVAVVTVVSVPFLAAVNQNIREWILIRFARFRQQHRETFMDSLL